MHLATEASPRKKVRKMQLEWLAPRMCLPLLPQAETRFRAALAADPSSADAHAGLAAVRQRTGDDAGARTEAMSSLRLHPNAQALVVLARLDIGKNALTVAADEVSQALQLDPGSADAKALRQTLQGRGQSVR